MFDILGEFELLCAEIYVNLKHLNQISQPNLLFDKQME